MNIPTLQLPVKERVRIFITGGAIDCSAIGNEGIYYFGKTHIPKMLKQGRVDRSSVRFDELMLKDSSHMNDKDRETILEHCRMSKEKRILITHGTDTMIRSAAHVARNLPSKDKKTVVFTGSIIPFNQPGSDAMFNLNGGLIAAQLLLPGIYIAMNGRVFNWNNIRKNRPLQIFETLDR